MVAEAAKVIENTQRDVNIALINELALIFNRLNIDSEEVLNAEESKWNFCQFRPGLVGGHCIGVDPYYLTHKAIEVGYNPEMILAGRRLKDNMGLTFKEKCPDLRNTRVIDLVSEFENFNCNVDVYDPWADQAEAYPEYGITPVSEPTNSNYDAIVLAVAHDEFKQMTLSQIKAFGKDNHVIYDIKYIFEAYQVDGRL